MAKKKSRSKYSKQPYSSTRVIKRNVRKLPTAVKYGLAFVAGAVAGLLLNYYTALVVPKAHSEREMLGKSYNMPLQRKRVMDNYLNNLEELADEYSPRKKQEIRQRAESILGSNPRYLDTMISATDNFSKWRSQRSFSWMQVGFGGNSLKHLESCYTKFKTVGGLSIPKNLTDGVYSGMTEEERAIKHKYEGN